MSIDLDRKQIDGVLHLIRNGFPTGGAFGKRIGNSSQFGSRTLPTPARGQVYFQYQVGRDSLGAASHRLVVLVDETVNEPKKIYYSPHLYGDLEEIALAYGG